MAPCGGHSGPGNRAAAVSFDSRARKGPLMTRSTCWTNKTATEPLILSRARALHARARVEGYGARSVAPHGAPDAQPVGAEDLAHVVRREAAREQARGQRRQLARRRDGVGV